MKYVFFLWRHGGSVVTMVVSILSHPMTLLIWVMTDLGYTMISMTSHWIPGLVNVNIKLWKDPPWISWENPRTKSSCSSSLFVNVYHWISPRSWPRSQWLGRFSSTRVDASLMDPRPAPGHPGHQRKKRWSRCGCFFGKMKFAAVDWLHWYTEYTAFNTVVSHVLVDSLLVVFEMFQST